MAWDKTETKTFVSYDQSIRGDLYASDNAVNPKSDMGISYAYRYLQIGTTIAVNVPLSLPHFRTPLIYFEVNRTAIILSYQIVRLQNIQTKHSYQSVAWFRRREYHNLGTY